MKRFVEFTRYEKCFCLNRIESDEPAFAHLIILSISELRSSAVVSGLSTIIYRLVSSAKSRLFDPMSSTMSLINNKKRSGPKIDPCGTPARMVFHLD